MAVPATQCSAVSDFRSTPELLDGEIETMEQHQAFEERYRAVQSRDSRFDGQFVTAVSSTGIYCRPSCPARTPKPANLTFYTTSAAAHEAGYRACKRCLPEATPGAPEWNIRQDLAARAMRLIREGVMNDGGAAALSTRLGYSSRHLQRVLTAELGAGPLALARAHRAQTARTLLVTTDLSASDIAFAAGFTSVRQFNQTVREVFDATPSHIRARCHPIPASTIQSRPSDNSLSDGVGTEQPLTLDLELPVRQPFDAPGVFRFLAQRALPGVESAQLTQNHLSYARTLALSGGPAALELTATGENSHWRLRLRCELASLADVPAIVSAARRLLDLDADPAAVDAALAQDTQLAPLIHRTPGIRLPGTADSEEYVFRAVVGQQISVPAARTHLARLAAALGTPYESAIPGLTTLFPTPAQILAGVPDPTSTAPQQAGQHHDRPRLDPDRLLRLPARSIRAVRSAAQALVMGELQVHSGVAPQLLHQQLTALPGIGQWTASYLTLRTLGHPDTWMTGDVALVAGARNLGLIDPNLSKSMSHRALAQHAQAWSPWRSYAAMHLWSSVA